MKCNIPFIYGVCFAFFKDELQPDFHLIGENASEQSPVFIVVVTTTSAGTPLVICKKPTSLSLISLPFCTGKSKH